MWMTCCVEKLFLSNQGGLLTVTMLINSEINIKQQLISHSMGHLSFAKTKVED